MAAPPVRAFLSHASADNSLAKLVYRTLRDQAVSVWFDRIEIRPGDSLLQAIAQGIHQSEILLVLVTEASNKSAWVQKEISMAVAREMAGDGLRVVPLLVEGNAIPPTLVDRVFVPIDPHANGLEAIGPVIFPSSFLLDLELNRSDLTCDTASLVENLYEFLRSDRQDVRVRIKNHGFNRKLDQVVEAAIAEHRANSSFVAQIREVSQLFPVMLPLYWVNLSETLGQVVNAIFAELGRNLGTVADASLSIQRVLRFAERSLVRRISGAAFSRYAETLGFPEIAALLDRNGASLNAEDADFVRQTCDLPGYRRLADVQLVGKADRQVRSARCRVPVLNDMDMLVLQTRVSPETYILPFDWYTVVLPQVCNDYLSEAVAQGKPSPLLGFKLGASVTDFQWIGLA